MDRQVKVFIEGRALDLFNDEQIQVSTSIQNVTDISKTHTDMSQSFTVPGTSNNNQIFEHFYENSVDGSLDYGLRRDGYIEIDLTLFRRGRISLEKATVVNGSIQNYTITFYGELLSLKDKFGDDRLQDLDYSGIDHDYSYTEVIDRVVGNISDPDVAYPLISSIRLWEYNGSNANYNSPNYVTATTTNNDIHYSVGAINYRELFPAVRIPIIMRLIEIKYGISFSSSFFNNEKFQAAYLYFKNRIPTNITTQAQYIDLDVLLSNIWYQADPDSYVDMALNTINTVYLPSFVHPTLGLINFYNHKIYIKNTYYSASYPYYIDFYKDGVLYTTMNGQQNLINGVTQDYITIPNVSGLDSIWTIKVRAQQPLGLQFEVGYEIWQSGYINRAIYQTTVNALTSFTDLANCAPNMKVSDFFSGVMKEFNLVCEATALNQYTVEPLLDWYAAGRVFDITEYTDVSSVEVAKVPLYKRIAFKYQSSESAMNKYYYEKSNKEYGNTEQLFPYDGGEYNIEVPFENLMFNKFTGTNLQVGYCVNSSLAPYVPKPMILYKYGIVTLADHIYYTDGSAHNSRHNYLMFGQDFTGTDHVDYSLNFAPETSTYHEFVINYSLFATYYFQYLYNLYNVKNRITTVKTILPISLLTGLRMNDRVIIRDKRYIINDLNSNLTTGDVTMTLLNDFMPVSPDDIIPPLPEDREV